MYLVAWDQGQSSTKQQGSETIGPTITYVSKGESNVVTLTTFHASCIFPRNFKLMRKTMKGLFYHFHCLTLNYHYRIRALPSLLPAPTAAPARSPIPPRSWCACVRPGSVAPPASCRPTPAWTSPARPARNAGRTEPENRSASACPDTQVSRRETLQDPTFRG